MYFYEQSFPFPQGRIYHMVARVYLIPSHLPTLQVVCRLNAISSLKSIHFESLTQTTATSNIPSQTMCVLLQTKVPQQAIKLLI
jgi:hypothetical protein